MACLLGRKNPNTDRDTCHLYTKQEISLDRNLGDYGQPGEVIHSSSPKAPVSTSPMTADDQRSRFPPMHNYEFGTSVFDVAPPVGVVDIPSDTELRVAGARKVHLSRSAVS